VKLTIVTPHEEKVAREVESVTLPGGKGEVCILPGHLPLLSTLEVGVLSFAAGGAENRFAVSRGFFEVLGDEVRVLTETCEAPEEVDRDRAEAALKRARDRLEASARDASVDVDRAMAALRRATARLSLGASSRPSPH